VPRERKDKTMMKCRECYKRRVAQLLRDEAEEREIETQRLQSKRRDSQSASAAAAAAVSGSRSASILSLVDSSPDVVTVSPPSAAASAAAVAAASSDAFAAAVGASSAKRHRDADSSGRPVGEHKDARRSPSPSRPAKRLATKSAMTNNSHHESHFSFDTNEQ
jgi:hypothetical protein